MRHGLYLAAALLVGAVATPAAAAMVSDADQPLSAFLADCQSDRQGCLDILAAGIFDANDSHRICLPDSLSLDGAAAVELQWLEDAAAGDAGLAAGKEADAEDKARAALWPCRN